MLKQNLIAFLINVIKVKYLILLPITYNQLVN